MLNVNYMCNKTTIDPITYIKKRSIILVFYKKEINSTTIDPIIKKKKDQDFL